MIESLQIENFRRFSNYRLADIAPVSLLVGENNCGKSSVLEAVHFWALSDSAALRIAADRRGEQVYAETENGSAANRWYPTVQNFIHGYQIAPNAKFGIVAPKYTCNLQIVEFYKLQSSYFDQRFRDFGVQIVRSDVEHPVEQFPIRSDGAFDFRRMSPGIERLQELRVKTQLLGSEYSPFHLRALWDNANQTGMEGKVLDAVRLVAPELDRLHFDSIPLATDNPRVGVKYGDHGVKELKPFGSLGGGVYRTLELALALVYCRDGVCLIDDIESGLHWSLMGDMWRVLIQTAKENGTQVFASTHSYDCLKGLAWACENYPELAGEVSVQTIKPELGESIAMPGERLPFAIDQEIEVR